ncbi:MAG: BrnA antitoxin family protein [Chloroflexi bacterium]|nr:BrnA antitoxin family protein [Chloroflexota bacterium]
MKNKLDLPEFANEDEEREFWAGVDLSDYFEPDYFAPVSFPNLKSTSRAISIRFPEYVLDAVKARANEMGVPYQALIKEAVIKAYLPQE